MLVLPVMEYSLMINGSSHTTTGDEMDVRAFAESVLGAGRKADSFVEAVLAMLDGGRAYDPQGLVRHPARGTGVLKKRRQTEARGTSSTNRPYLNQPPDNPDRSAAPADTSDHHERAAVRSPIRSICFPTMPDDRNGQPGQRFLRSFPS